MPSLERMPRRQYLAHVVDFVSLGEGIGRVDLEAENLASGVLAGRFAMLETVQRPDCILPRPFSYFARTGAHRVAFLLQVVGAGTQALLQLPRGAAVHVLGPLGNGYPAVAGAVWAVAGGVGAAPFGVLPTQQPPWHVLLGTRSLAQSGFASALQACGASVEIACESAATGYFHGNVVALLQHKLQQQTPPAAIFTCGPTAMMAKVAQLAAAANIACYVNLEARMACGIGICRGCAHRDTHGAWRCICVDGPVYPAATIFGSDTTRPSDA